MDRRVTAKATARARAARPAIWASAMGAPSGSAVVSATGRPSAFCTEIGVGVGFGSSVGNKPAALPPGLRVGLAAGMFGRLPTGSGAVTVSGVCGLAEVGFAAAAVGVVTAMAADALGSVARVAALPIAVRLTDLTVAAVTGTVSWACSCRWADFASTVPRAHEEVPSSLPQPKLNPGAPPTVGVARSRTITSERFPPVVQALTVHWAG